MTSTDEKFMLQALSLAEKGIGSVEPNPPVGAVLVKNGKIIGKGWHKKFGEHHAEIIALQDCEKKGNKPAGATMYVTLEPCSHKGKTGPCTKQIIKSKVARVFIAMIDPSKHARSKGIKQLKQAGIEVQIGLCERNAKILYAPFVKWLTTAKPWIILKWAQTIDGRMASIDQPLGGAHRWISNEQSRKDAHRLRGRVNAILAGVNTVIADNPLLTPRPGKVKKPLRIILDASLKTPVDSQLVNTASKIPLLIVTSEKAIAKNSRKVQTFREKGVLFLSAPVEKRKCNIDFVAGQLKNYGVYRLLVESGPTVITSFLTARLADEIIIYIAPKILAARGFASISEAVADLTEPVNFNVIDIKSFGDNIRIRALLTNP